MEAEFEREVLDRLIKIEGKLDGYNNAKVKTYENEKEILRIKSDLEDVQKTVTDLTESNKWLFLNCRGGYYRRGHRTFNNHCSNRRRIITENYFYTRREKNNMNIEFIIENASKIILIVAAICTLISVITEFTKGIGFLDKIPTKFQVLILSLVICVIGFFAYLVLRVNRVRMVLPGSCHFRGVHRGDRVLQGLGLFVRDLGQILQKEGLINVGKRFCYQNRAVCHKRRGSKRNTCFRNNGTGNFRKRLRLY